MKNRLFLFSLFISLLFLSACSLRDSSSSVTDETDLPPKRSYDLIEEALADKNGLKVDDFTLGIKKLTETHFRGIVKEKEGSVLAFKKGEEWVIVFDGAFGDAKTYRCEDVSDYEFPIDMIEDCA